LAEGKGDMNFSQQKKKKKTLRRHAHHKRGERSADQSGEAHMRGKKRKPNNISVMNKK